MKLTVLFVVDFHAFSNPAHFPLLESAQRKSIWLHSFIEKGMLLAEVDDIKFEGHVFGSIFYTKVKPLVVAFSIDIVLKNQIVLIILSLIDSEKISRLEIGAEFCPASVCYFRDVRTREIAHFRVFAQI